jgi:protein-disulfide isomerase
LGNGILADDQWLPVNSSRVRAAAAVVGVLLLSGCGGTSIPSQSGTLTNAAVTNGAKPKKFNPFVEEDTTLGKRVVIENPTIAQVMQPGALPERSIGRPDAPITVIKYASMTCPYCRQFQAKTFPILKKRYIDSGKIRLILREFPIGFQSGSATIALRCVPEDKYFAAYSALMKGQPKWISQQVRREPIWNIVRKFGLSRAAFDACYQDKALIANLNTVKDRGRTLGVIGTPNFFVNGKLYKRVLTMTDFDRAVAGGLATATAQN